MPSRDQGRIKIAPMFIEEWTGRLQPLSPDAAGCYVRLYLAYLRNQGPLENQRTRIARVAGCSGKKFDAVMREITDFGLMEIRGHLLYDEQAEHVLAKFRARQRAGRAAADTRWRRIEGAAATTIEGDADA